MFKGGYVKIERRLIALALLLLLLPHPLLRANQASSGQLQGQKLSPTNSVEADQESLLDSKDEIEYKRSKMVSEYGAVPLIQKPVEWGGRLLDGLVWGIQKIGQGTIYIATWPLKFIKKSK